MDAQAATRPEVWMMKTHTTFWNQIVLLVCFYLDYVWILLMFCCDVLFMSMLFTSPVCRGCKGPWVTFSGTITSQAIDDPNPPKKKLNTFGLELEQPPSPVVTKFALGDVRCTADGWSAAAMSFLKVIITFSILKNQALKI